MGIYLTGAVILICGVAFAVGVGELLWRYANSKASHKK